LNRFVEIRVYSLEPGTRDEFHRLVLGESVPMLRHQGIDVVAFGPSRHDEDYSYFLIRAFDGLEDRKRREAAFYGSDEWRNGPRQQIEDCIVAYTTVVVEVDPDAIEGLRRLGD
jgi:hypothetical protein